MSVNLSRRNFLQTAGIGTLGAISAGTATKPLLAAEPDASVLGKDGVATSARSTQIWKQTSDRKIRVGIVGYGVCHWGAAFSFQHHPNVEVAAVSDLLPARCAALAKACRCEKTYPSLEELVKDETLEAVFVATDAPSHAKHSIAALKHGKHVACAVPAAFGSLEEADHLHEAVKSSGLTYMMFETSAFHPDLFEMRQIYTAGGFGKLIYSEGQYFHYMPIPLESYQNWRVGVPPQWYPTHSNAYHICVTGGSFTEVTCMGMPSVIDHLKSANNVYQNPYGTEIAIFRTSEGGMARMAVSWDTNCPGTESGSVRGQLGSMIDRYHGSVKLPQISIPALPPNVEPGGHRGSHGYLMNEFVSALIENRKPVVDIASALNLTVSGIVAHQSALKDGELLKIPQY